MIDLVGCRFESQDGLIITVLQKSIGSGAFWVCDEKGPKRTTRAVLSEEYLLVSCKELPSSTALSQGRLRYGTKEEYEESLYFHIEDALWATDVYEITYIASNVVASMPGEFLGVTSTTSSGYDDKNDMFLFVDPIAGEPTTGYNQCTCGAASIRGVHSNWCDLVNS